MAKITDIVLLGMIAGIGYFIWKGIRGFSLNGLNWDTIGKQLDTIESIGFVNTNVNQNGQISVTPTLSYIPSSLLSNSETSVLNRVYVLYVGSTEKGLVPEGYTPTGNQTVYGYYRDVNGTILDSTRFYVSGLGSPYGR